MLTGPVPAELAGCAALVGFGVGALGAGAMMTDPGFRHSFTSPGKGDPIVLLAKLKIKPEKREEFLEFVSALNKAEQAAKPGTLIFQLSPHPSEADTFTWTEVYQHGDAWSAHLDFQSQTPALKADFEKYPIFLDGAVELDCYGQMQLRSDRDDPVG